MAKKLSPIWVKSPTGRVLHHKREYTKVGGRTLCGIHVGPYWFHLPGRPDPGMHKCKRCAA